MPRVDTIPASPAHIAPFLAVMTESSKRGILLLGQEIVPAIEMSLAESAKAWTILIDDEIVTITGVVPRFGYGQVWCLLGRALKQVPRAHLSFARAARKVLKDLSAGYKVVGNVIPHDDVETTRFVKMLGFGISGHPIKYGPFGTLFDVIRREAP